MKDDHLYVVHISECIERVEKYTADGEEAFFADAKTQDAVVRNLQILAESSQRISSELKDRFPQVEWRTIAAFRNVAVHDYLGIDLIQIWKIVKEDLPVLKKAVNDILKYLNQNTKSDH